MSHINAGDPRAHASPDEKEAIARALVKHARALILADQPRGVDACNECVGASLMLALGLLVEEIKTGKYDDEKLGLARRFDVMADLCDQSADDLRKAANDRIPPFLADLIRWSQPHKNAA